jgi:hypothetical protein
MGVLRRELGLFCRIPQGMLGSFGDPRRAGEQTAVDRQRGGSAATGIGFVLQKFRKARWVRLVLLGGSASKRLPAGGVVGMLRRDWLCFVGFE